MAKSYAKKSEKLAKMQQEMGTCLVDIGMQEKDQWFAETMMKLGESLKSLSMINHALVRLLFFKKKFVIVQP